MAEAKKAAEKATKAYVPTRNAETAVGSLVHGETVYLHDDERVRNLVDAGYLLPQKDYLEQTDEATLNQMEREQGVSAREG
jgi:hypothetical protein